VESGGKEEWVTSMLLPPGVIFYFRVRRLGRRPNGGLRYRMTKDSVQ
jgi:hypothetical protein